MGASGITHSGVGASSSSSDVAEYLPIVLVKEYYWCPIQALFKLVAWWEKPTASMEAGGLDGEARAHLIEKLRETGVDGEEYWEVEVYSKRLLLRGRVDLIVDTGEGLVLVEAKLSATKTMLRRRGVHLLAQLAAYTIAAEETLGEPVTHTYLYIVEANELLPVRINPRHRRLVEEAATALHSMIANPDPTRLPPPPRRRCTTCSYRSLCPHNPQAPT